MTQRRQHGGSDGRGASPASCPRKRTTQCDDTMAVRLRCRRNGRQLLLVRAAVIAAVLAVGAEAREQVQSTGLSSCPATTGSSGGDAGREEVVEWNAWTTNQCAANYAAAIGGDGDLLDDQAATVVCVYYDPASFSDAEQRLSVQKMCRSETHSSSTTLAGTHACYDNGDCLVKFMNVTPVSSSDAWEFRLGDLAADTGKTMGSSREPVRVGELVVSSRVSKLYDFIYFSMWAYLCVN